MRSRTFATAEDGVFRSTRYLILAKLNRPATRNYGTEVKVGAASGGGNAEYLVEKDRIAPLVPSRSPRALSPRGGQFLPA